jgi:uncharacterized Zn finger protein (UPF0148 family)
MGRPMLCKFCVEKTKLVPYGKKGDMKCPSCGKIRKKEEKKIDGKKGS